MLSNVVKICQRVLDLRVFETIGIPVLVLADSTDDGFMFRPIQPGPSDAGTLICPVAVEEIALTGVNCDAPRFARLAKLCLMKDSFSEMC